MKRFFSRLALLAMAGLLICCVPALAEEIDLSAQSGTVMVTEPGTYTLRGALSDGQILVDVPKTEKVELILSGAEITSANGPAVWCREAKDLILTLTDSTENSLTDSAAYAGGDEADASAALFSQCDLKIRGTGSLSVTGNYKHGIATKDDLKIEGGQISVTSASDALRGKDSVTIEGGTIALQAGKDGISATDAEDPEKGWVSISGGVLQINACGDGIQAETNLTITGGDFTIRTEGRSSGTSNSQKGIKAEKVITISDGTFRLNTRDDAIHAKEDLTIDGGDFTIEAGDDGVHADRLLTVNGGSFQIPVCYEGFESTGIVINGGSIFISASDDAIGASANTAEAKDFFGRDGNPAVSVAINGGEIEAYSGGDTVDSNGDILVSGGKLRLSSPADPYYEGVLLCNGRVTVTGGDLAMVGNIGVELTVENQPMLLVSHAQMQSSGSTVSLADAQGNTLLSVLARRDYRQTIFSSPELQVGQTYTVSIDGTPITELTLTGMINKAADDGGVFTGGYPRGHW